MDKILVDIGENKGLDRGGHEDDAFIWEDLRGSKVILETHSAVKYIYMT